MLNLATILRTSASASPESAALIINDVKVTYAQLHDPVTILRQPSGEGAAYTGADSKLNARSRSSSGKGLAPPTGRMGWAATGETMLNGSGGRPRLLWGVVTRYLRSTA